MPAIQRRRFVPQFDHPPTRVSGFVTEDADRSRVQCEVLPSDQWQPDPSRRQGRTQLAVREKSDVAAQLAQPPDETVDMGRQLVGRLTVGQPSRQTFQSACSLRMSALRWPS